jgi:hemolysin III
VHTFGVSFGLLGAIALFLVSLTSTTVNTSVVAIYAAGLLTMLVMSATYNLWPVCPRKWLLRLKSLFPGLADQLLRAP